MTIKKFNQIKDYIADIRGIGTINNKSTFIGRLLNIETIMFQGNIYHKILGVFVIKES